MDSNDLPTCALKLGERRRYRVFSCPIVHLPLDPLCRTSELSNSFNPCKMSIKERDGAVMPGECQSFAAA